MAKRRSGDGNSGNHDGHELISLLYSLQAIQFTSGYRLLLLNYITFCFGDAYHALISTRILGYERIRNSLFVILLTNSRHVGSGWGNLFQHLYYRDFTWAWRLKGRDDYMNTR